MATGSKKTALDPFLPLTTAGREQLDRVFHDVYANFTAVVRERRGSKLKPTRVPPPDAQANNGAEESKRARHPDEELDVFSGDVFPTSEAIAKGLVDEVGNLHSVAEKELGKDVQFIHVRPGFWSMTRSGSGMRTWLLARLVGGADTEAAGAAFASGAVTAVDDKAAWARFGL